MVSPPECLDQLFPDSLGVEPPEATPSPQVLGAIDPRPSSLATKKGLSLEDAQPGRQRRKPGSADAHALVSPILRETPGLGLGSGTPRRGRGTVHDLGTHGP